MKTVNTQEREDTLSECAATNSLPYNEDTDIGQPANDTEEQSCQQAEEAVSQVNTEGWGDVNPPARQKTFGYGCYIFFKRATDIIVSATVMIVFCWLFLILALAVKLSDGGKVIYKHKRVGKGGKSIYISKFRSMRDNADKIEDCLTPEQLEEYKREYKVDRDPRITPLGRFLRRTSLDELPQFWDVFVGRISFVGPRPLVEDELRTKYGEYAEKLVSVKPGLIGWWAASGRSNTVYETGERQQRELYYVDHCGILFDLKIILKTVIEVIKRDGAK